MSPGEAECFECGTPVSYETGFAMTGGLGDSSEDRIWCPEHAPDQGRGYTLSDMQRWREDSQVERAKYEIAKMEQLGPDVYLAVQNGPPLIPGVDVMLNDDRCVCGHPQADHLYGDYYDESGVKRKHQGECSRCGCQSYG